MLSLERKKQADGGHDVLKGFSAIQLEWLNAGGRDIFKEPSWSDPPMNKQPDALDLYGGESTPHASCACKNPNVTFRCLLPAHSNAVRLSFCQSVDAAQTLKLHTPPMSCGI